jgi:hypothetical protein
MKTVYHFRLISVEKACHFTFIQTFSHYQLLICSFLMHSLSNKLDLDCVIIRHWISTFLIVFIDRISKIASSYSLWVALLIKLCLSLWLPTIGQSFVMSRVGCTTPHSFCLLFVAFTVHVDFNQSYLWLHYN